MTQSSGEQCDGAIQASSFSDENIQRFLCVVEKSARQWQIIVFPSMIAFIVLAIFGFYLIYNLTGDIRTIARSIDPKMSQHMAQMTDSMQKMSVDMRSLPPMLAHMQRLDGSVNSMAADTQNMNNSMRSITYSNDHMRHSMAKMTNSVRPMSMFNTFMPW